MEFWPVIVILLFVAWLVFRGHSTKSSSLSTTPGVGFRPSLEPGSTTARNIVRRPKAAQFVSGIPSDFQLTPEFSNAIDRLNNSTSTVFITGKAGTGKSTLLQYFIQHTKKKVVVVAPTGVAAINVGGVTIHSFFRFPPRLVRPEDVKPILRKRDLFHSLDAVVVDEVSMVRADVMDAIDLSLRLNRNRKDEPFGGVQMILVGDLYQLPPIVEDELAVYFDDNYSNPYFFGSKVFQTSELSVIELQRVFRQKDENFIALLNKVRDNRLTSSDVQELNQRSTNAESRSHGDVVITLTATNALAAEINQAKLESLQTRELSFHATIIGEFDNKSFPTEKTLRLKEGAQVMMVKNDAGRRWVNGTLGVIDKLSNDSIRVRVGSSSEVVEQVVWEKTDYEYDAEAGKIVPIVIGSFKQYPIKLAWAITVHKSQGKSFDQVDIDLGNGAFAHGQAYVALSRCRTFEGMRLRKPIKLSDVILDDRIVQFLSRGNGT